MYTSQIISPMPAQNLSYIIPQTQQIIPVQPLLTQSFIQVPQVPQMNYIMPQAQIPSYQQFEMTQNPVAMAYSRYIPPTPTCSATTPPKIYQFYKYVPVEQQQQPIYQQGPQYQIASAPVMYSGSYIIQ